MNKLKIILGILIVGVLAVSGVVLAASNNQAGERVYVLTDNAMVKAMLGVNHEFPGAFSTKVSARSKTLSSLGLIKTKPVQLYQTTGKPGTSCGNGVLEPGEKCESNHPCSDGYTCENCKCVEETAPPERFCTPSKQIPWGVAKINGGSGGTGIKVAVLDTGVHKDHLDLKANIIDCKDATKRRIKNGCFDGNGHGTHVAGTIAANGGSDKQGISGVAPEAKIMAIKVCGLTGCWGDDIAVAIKYAADKGANIISMSLGGDSQDYRIKNAIDYAVGEGVLVVAAAGNYHSIYNPNNAIQYPAANLKVIAVGAIDSVENVASWSSRGVNNGDYIVEEREVEFGAPGVSVESTFKDGCYVTWQGTSMATPHVAGLAAKLWNTDAVITRTKLQELAKLHDLHTEGDDTATGFGLPIAP